ncbi:hypothetical protein C8F01DRAFT_1206591 [Mycena amicta]|nr:hypothetical protein C8F01DRAFT_1206591 [Mycena amicta]
MPALQSLARLPNQLGRCRLLNPSSGWYPGAIRCTYKTCTFSGSKQSVETHMSDRHLIHPPGWHNRNKKPEWDADPSLKGHLPIQGTNILLNTPAALADWLAERKRRWPSTQLVSEKKRKLEEAAARGELAAEAAFGQKRRRTVDDRGATSGRGAWRGRGRPFTTAAPRTTSAAESQSSDHSDDDAPPDVVSSKARPREVSTPTPTPITRPRAQQPKNPLHNSFASRPTLLRNLLLPEIRITVSNLSQAIRFLVDNDFLRNVELKPGQANEKLIEVLDTAME